ncbi:MAG: hypothetical protein R3Y57_03640 [Erysipelotrichaceae bacterium]
MKKIVTLGLVTVLMLIMGVTAFAAAPTFGTSCADAHVSSVCDNFGRYTNFIDEDDNGINDNIGNDNGCYFVDEDSDGTCDNAVTRQGTQKSMYNDGKCRNRN